MSHKTLKYLLKKCVTCDVYYDWIKEHVERANFIIFTCSNFIRLFLIKKYNSDEELPKLDKDFIMTCFRVLIIKTNGPKQKKKLKIKEELEKFYINDFIKILRPNIQNITTNNIKLNFFKYIRQFVNQTFKDSLEKQLNNCTVFKTKLRNKLKREYNQIKNDLINNTLLSHPQYHKWINKTKIKILPQINDTTYEDDIKNYPYKYIKYMITMNRFLERKGYKMFQPISLRTDLKDKYITINSHALLDILPIANKGNKFKIVGEIKQDLWNFVLNIKKLKLKNYSFNYQIQTDGYGISINYIHNNDIEKKNTRIKKLKDASRKGKLNNKNKTRDEIIKETEKKKQLQIQKKKEYQKKRKLMNKKLKDKFNKLPKEEQEKIKLDIKMKKEEFNYIGDLVKFEMFYKELKKAHRYNKLVYCDPGKRSPGVFLGDNDKILNYTTGRRLKETKRLKYNKLINNKKKNIKIIKNKTIKEIESRLAKLSKNTTYLGKAKKFTKIKLDLKYAVRREKTYNNYLRKLNWYGYINKKRHEDKLLNNIEKEFGKDVTIIMGDWGNKGKLSFISTPGIGLKRLLKRKYKVYHIDEFRTSKLHHKTEKECNNLKIIFNEKKRKLHSVLTYQMSNGRLGCINRDINAVKNMKKITESLLKIKERPEKYRRKKLTKSANPSYKIEVSNNRHHTKRCSKAGGS